MSEREAENNDLICGSSSGDKLGTTGGSFHGVLFLAVEIKNGLVDGMCDPGDGSSSNSTGVNLDEPMRTLRTSTGNIQC